MNNLQFLKKTKCNFNNITVCLSYPPAFKIYERCEQLSLQLMSSLLHFAKSSHRPDPTLWRAGFGPRAVCLTPLY